jgi:hypothetical protein
MSPAGAKHLSFRRRRCSDADRPVEASSSELSLLSSTSSSSAIALSRFVGIGLISGSRIIAIDAPPREAHCRGRCLPPLNGATSPTDTPGWSTNTGSVSSAATTTGHRRQQAGVALAREALIVDGDSAAVAESRLMVAGVACAVSQWRCSVAAITSTFEKVPAGAESLAVVATSGVHPEAVTRRELVHGVANTDRRAALYHAHRSTCGNVRVLRDTLSHSPLLVPCH